MADNHVKTYFGQQSAVTIISNSKQEPFIMIRIFKKNANNVWEKPSKGEGVIVKLSIEEVILVLEVFRKNKTSWKTFHNYKNQKK